MTRSVFGVGVRIMVTLGLLALLWWFIVTGFVKVPL